MNLYILTNLLGTCVIAAPALLLAVLGIMPLISRPLGEVAVARWTASCVVAGLLATLGVLAIMLLGGSRSIPVDLGDWAAIPAEHFHFRVKLAFDRLSVPFAILTFVLAGATGAFAGRYLHREPGFGRFYLAFAIFLLGMTAASLAGTIETLFLGWELVGLSSALLVAFFHERSSPVLNAERTWTVYRVSDAAFLLAAIALHRASGSGDFAGLMGAGPWPEGAAALSSRQASWAGLLLLIAAAGKSALIPFSGWLPRAMEGPTPSSAVFYGALSVHLGTFLLLRIGPILDLSAWLSAATVALGLSTAILATIAGRAQADAKGALAYASLTQVGIITAEIGMGLRYLPLIHIIGHACLRTLQLLRAPSLLRDHRGLEDAVGGRLDRGDGAALRWLPGRFRLGVYRAGFQRGQLDEALDRWIVRPFVGCFRLCDRLERRWADFLSGIPPRESGRPAAGAAPREGT